VDPNTCQYFIPENALGMGQKLTLDGTFETSSFGITPKNIGNYVNKKGSSSGTEKTIPISTKGVYMIRGGTTTIDGMSGNCEFHILMFFEPDNGLARKVLHIYQKNTSILGYEIPSVGSELIDDFTASTITVRSTDTQYGSWIVYEE
jgi:hypothetical protein